MSTKIRKKTSDKNRKPRQIFNRPSMFLEIAKEFEFKVPEDPDNSDPGEWIIDFPHFGSLFSFHATSLFIVENIRATAKALNGFEEEQLMKEVSREDLKEAGAKI